MTVCTLSIEDKKLYGKEIGEILVKNHGQKKFYSSKQVKVAADQSMYAVDWYCWAMCLYMSRDDFNDYHESIGEVCNYTSMKSEMTSLLTNGASDVWFDVDLSWLEWPDIELPSIFDFIDF